MKSPKIIKKTILAEGNQANLILFIPQNIIYFEGHFPDTPVLPGVVQVDWAIEFAANIFNLNKEKINSINQLKFTQVILPESTLTLSLSLVNQKVLFKYINGVITYSSGKISF